LFPIAFWYEHSAAWRGRRDYYRQKYKHKKTSTGLRRNIHRLEKALIMKPRRPLFAEQYIEETVEFFAAAIERPAEEIDRMDREELEWAQDVLSEYFASIYGKSKRIDEARSKFMSIFVQRNTGSRKPGPKPHGAIPSFDSLLALSEQRRSVRWFDQRPVPRNLIDQAFLVARQSPSACNRLPYSFFVIDDSARVRHIASIPFGTAGFSDNIPTLIVVVGHLSQFFSTRDRHTIYIDSSLATMSFLLALETVGLASTIINWPEIPPLDYKIKKELGLLDSDRVIMMIAVGFTDTSCNVPYSAKKELDTFRLYLDKTISGE
jgi:nitroreductase